MPKKRIVSKIIQAASARAAGIESIDPAPNMGTDVTLQGYKTLIAAGTAQLATYNTLLAEVGEAKNQIERLEKQIRDYSERMLAAVAVKFGKDSDEYEMAGGTKKSERRRPVPAVVAPLNAAA